MTGRSAPKIVLLSGPGTLRGLGPEARALGLRLRRVPAIRVEPCLPRRVSSRLPGGRNPDTIVVTSRHAVQPALLRLLRGWGSGEAPQVWAAGPGTAARLRRLGVRHVRQGAGLGAEGILRRLGPRRRVVLHVRSDLAGTALARALRARGHRAYELVAYRVVPAIATLRRQMPEIQRASVLVVTSPSCLEGLSRASGAVRLHEIARATPLVALGERTARAARHTGFARVSVAGTTAPKRFARLLLRAVADAPS